MQGELGSPGWRTNGGKIEAGLIEAGLIEGGLNEGGQAAGQPQAQCQTFQHMGLAKNGATQRKHIV